MNSKLKRQLMSALYRNDKDRIIALKRKRIWLNMIANNFLNHKMC